MLPAGQPCGIGLECAATDCVPLADLGLRLSREPAVQLVVVCVDPDPDLAIRAIKMGAEQFSHPIFAATAGDTAAIQSSARQAGAADVWTLNELKEELLRSHEELHRGGGTPNRRGRVVAVTASLPGSRRNDGSHRAGIWIRGKISGCACGTWSRGP